MKIDDLVNKSIIIETRDNKTIEGILISIKDIYDSNNEPIYSALIIRTLEGEYETIYINEIESLGAIE